MNDSGKESESRSAVGNLGSSGYVKVLPSEGKPAIKESSSVPAPAKEAPVEDKKG
jgi:hypothetical protein